MDHSPKKFYKLLLLFVMLYITADLASNILVYKLVAIKTIILPGSVFIFPLTYFFSDIMAEVYGYQISRQIIWFGFICNLFFSFCLLAVIHMHSPSFWHQQSAYLTVLSPLFRINLASILAEITGAFINIFLITKLKVLTKGRFFWARSITSTAFGEAVLIIIAGCIAFIGVMPFHDIVNLIISDYALKLIYAVVLAFPATIIVILLKKYEGSDVFDYHTNFNPFKFSVTPEKGE